MIIVKFQGGLGNQMFQYAMGRVLSKKNNIELKFDDNELNKIGPTGAYRSLEINVFDININKANNNEIKKFLPSFWQKKFFSILNKPIQTKKYYQEKNINFDENVFRLTDNFCLDGYWQSWKYFDAYADIIRKDFTLKIDYLNKIDGKLLAQINGSNSVAIHVRRGDYVTNQNVNKFHGICNKEYYDQAVEFLKNNVKNPKFFVFSDDPGWCKNEFDADFFIVSNYPGWHDLWLMSKCKHQIIANSSFSWWAGWLNDNNNKYVVVPKRWFSGFDIDNNYRFPENWIKI